MKLLIFVTHGNLDTIPVNLLQTSLEHHQLELRSFTSMFDLDFSSNTHLTSPTWFTYLWEFVCEHNIQLSISFLRRPQLLLHNDLALIDIFSKEQTLYPRMLRLINHARYYLEVFSLADITTCDGTKLR